MTERTHQHQHTPNRFAVIPTAERLMANLAYSGRQVGLAFLIDLAAEDAINAGIVVVAAAGNSEGMPSIPPANTPSAITVGGYSDDNNLNKLNPELYHSNYGITADGTVKPEIIAPAMFVAAPILPNTSSYETAEALSRLAATPDYLLLRRFW